MALIKKASTKKKFANEEKMLVRVMSSGVKFADLALRTMGLEKGDFVSYAEDTENGAVYVFKEEEGGAKLGDKGLCSNNGLISAMKKLAGVPNIEVVGGVQIHFDIEETPVNEEGEATGGDDAIFFKISHSKTETPDEVLESASEDNDLDL